MAGHAQLRFVMTECSKTQIRLTGLNSARYHAMVAFLFYTVGKRMVWPYCECDLAVLWKMRFLWMSGGYHVDQLF